MSSAVLKGKRIDLVFGSLELGGAERQGLLFADYLKKRCGAEVRVIGLNSAPGRLSELCDELDIPWTGVLFHWGLRRRLSSFLRAVQLLKANHPDILISYTRVPNMVCALGWKKAGARLCIWNQADEGLLMNRLPHFRLAVARAHCFISNSTGGKEFLVNTYGKAPEDIHVIYNGIDVPAPKNGREQWRRELGVAENAVCVCMIANLSSYKDHATLVRAWKIMLERSSFSVRPMLVLGGRHDGEEKNIAMLAQELGVVESVILPGKIDDVSGLLCSADLFVYSSRSEGIPNAVLEAMAAGLAVVGTDIPGIREAVGTEGVPFLSPVGDDQAMADRLLCLIEDEGTRSRLGHALKTRCQRLFGLEKMCSDTAELIGEAWVRVGHS